MTTQRSRLSGAGRAALALPVLAGLALAGGDAEARSRGSVLRDIRAYGGPPCRQVPDAIVTGRISGVLGYGVAGALSVEACFHSVGACERWLGQSSGKFGGRIFLAVCERRR